MTIAAPASIYHKWKLIQRIIRKQTLVRVMILISIFFTFLYINWRLMFSLPFRSGIFPVILNIILLLVEALGFAETLVHFWNMLNLRDHPLPVIGEEEYPEVDIFIATYNEPTDLLRKTINGCTHLLYPDKSKVHIWVCASLTVALALVGFFSSMMQTGIPFTNSRMSGRRFS